MGSPTEEGESPVHEKMCIRDSVKSVKDNGTFSIYGLPDVTASLSDNGNYLLIYTDTAIDRRITTRIAITISIVSRLSRISRLLKSNIYM